MLLDLLKGLGADVVLDLARLPGGGLPRDAQALQDAGEDHVALIDALGHLPPGGGQVDVPALVHIDVAVFPEAAHGDGDGGL